MSVKLEIVRVNLQIIEYLLTDSVMASSGLASVSHAARANSTTPEICSGVHLATAAVSFLVALPQFCSEKEYTAVLSFPDALLRQTGIRITAFPFEELWGTELTSISLL